MVIVVDFPGSSAEEVHEAYANQLGVKSEIVWHDTEHLPEAKLLVIPGGSSFGDYLRPGALAKTSPVAAQIRRYSRSGRVLGIGNGFQILCELGILPGAHLPNLEGKFVSDEVYVRMKPSASKLASHSEEIFRFPLACSFGRYYLDTRAAAEIEEQEQVVFQYCNDEGIVSTSPVTGSVKSIAGITNTQGNVLGLMFHPERCVEADFGGETGKGILLSALGT